MEKTRQYSALVRGSGAGLVKYRPTSTAELADWLEWERADLGLPELSEELLGYPNFNQILDSKKLAESSKVWIIYFRGWQAILLSIYVLMQASRDGKYRHWQNSCLSLSYRALTGIKALADLSQNGLEVQAFQIARVVSEDIQALALCVIDDEFSKEFSASNTVELANNFWHKRISKGKIKRELLSRFKIDEWAKELSLVRDEGDEERIFGAFIHPSYVSGLVHLFLDRESDEIGTLPWWRERPVPIGSRPYSYLAETFLDLGLALKARRSRLQGRARRTDISPPIRKLATYSAKSVQWGQRLALAGVFAGWLTNNDRDNEEAGVV